MLSVTVFGQANLIPKRIIYQGDTGVFFTRKQEVEILKNLEYKEIFKSNLDSMYEYSLNCTEALELSRNSFFKLYDIYTVLDSVAVEQTNRANKEEELKEMAQDSLAQEKVKKKSWRKAAIGEGILITGVVVGVVTGAWVPVATLVIVAEAAIIMDMKPPKFSMKNLFFKPE
jgi:hypothetical protein